jgi:uncharacterized protein YkwD
VARKLLIGLCVAALALTAAAPAALARRTAGKMVEMQSLAHGVLYELNRIREQHGLPPLTTNRDLQTAAQQHTSEMISDGYFAHDSFDGAAFWKRLSAYTSRAPHGSWSVGENLLWSSPDVGAVEALKLWMESPEHRANILSRDWRQIGIAAVYADPAPGTYGNAPVTVITTDFGARS